MTKRFPMPPVDPQAWFYELEAEHGKWLTFHERKVNDDGQTIGTIHRTLFQDGFYLVIDGDGNATYGDWNGPDTHEARHWAERYVKIRRHQAKKKFETARKAYQTEVNYYIDTGYEIEDREAKETALKQLHEDYLTINRAYRLRYVIPRERADERRQIADAAIQGEVLQRTQEMNSTSKFLLSLKTDDSSDDAE